MNFVESGECSKLDDRVGDGDDHCPCVEILLYNCPLSLSPWFVQLLSLLSFVAMTRQLGLMMRMFGLSHRFPLSRDVGSFQGCLKP